MKIKTILSLVALCTPVAVGCGIVGQSNAIATIETSQSRSLPEDVRPAMLWTVDGKRIMRDRHSYRVPPGRHSIGVLPVQNGPPSTTLAYAASAQARGVEIAELDINLEPGEVVEVAAVVRRHRVYSTAGGVTEALRPWQTTVLPYVVVKR